MVYLDGCPPPAPVHRGTALRLLIPQAAVSKAGPNGLELPAYSVRVFQHRYHQIDGGFFVQGAGSVSPKPLGVIGSDTVARRGGGGGAGQ